MLLASCLHPTCWDKLGLAHTRRMGWATQNMHGGQHTLLDDFPNEYFCKAGHDLCDWLGDSTIYPWFLVHANAMMAR
jgi:hypothetical protein